VKPTLQLLQGPTASAVKLVLRIQMFEASAETAETNPIALGLTFTAVGIYTGYPYVCVMEGLDAVRGCCHRQVPCYGHHQYDAVKV